MTDETMERTYNTVRLTLNGLNEVLEVYIDDKEGSASEVMETAKEGFQFLVDMKKKMRTRNE